MTLSVGAARSDCHRAGAIMGSKKQPAEFGSVGKPQQKLAGRHTSFSVLSRPLWHEDGEGQRSSAGTVQQLTIEIRLPNDLPDPVAARRTFNQIVSAKVAVKLPGMGFEGFVLKATWNQEVNQDGGYAGAVVSLTIDGQEK